MSTKAIREVLYWAMNMDFDRETLSVARAELEAIEQAAKVIDENVKIPAIPAELEPALRLMASIAKEAP